VPATRASADAVRGRRRHGGDWRESSALVALALIAACGFLVLEPWHGPTVLTLSEQHGVDVADLPPVALIAAAVAVSRLRASARMQRRWRADGRVAALSAIVLGVLLMAGILDPRVGSPLVPAGGGTFNGDTEQVSGVGALPVGRWSHLAVTYDGTVHRLYVDGVQVASRTESGPILRTSDPLWIGGNHPYGEYFRGVIDDVRVYNRALSPVQVRAAMSRPVTAGGRHVAGLVAAYEFDDARGRSVGDASGHRNAGQLLGATWTRSGRFGGGMRFDGAGELVRVPASASLDLTNAMTLAGWIEPSEPQSGWRTVLARQTDAYFLTAGGGRENAGRLEALDRFRFVLVLILIAVLGIAVAGDHRLSSARRRRWYWPLALFVAGSLVDVAFAPVDTLIGPALVASWCAATATHRDERMIIYALAAACAVVTIVAIAHQATLPLPLDAGGVVRSAALGTLLAVIAVLSVLRSRRAPHPPPEPSPD
jgi:hypothetical protein